MHFNLFDKIFGDKTQYDYVFINPTTSFYKNDKEYWVHACSWYEPKNSRKIFFYTIRRDSDFIRVWYNDIFWLPQDSDIIMYKNIKGTVLERIDNWIKVEGKDQLLEFVE
jgi:hypothetical protein